MQFQHEHLLSLVVTATDDLPRTAAHPFYSRPTPIASESTAASVNSGVITNARQAARILPRGSRSTGGCLGASRAVLEYLQITMGLPRAIVMG